MIQAADIERAEKIMSRAYSITQGTSANPKIIHQRAKVDANALDSLIRHHQAALFNPQGGYMPDLDPRYESPIMTMMLHFFALGAISQRVHDRREDVT